MPKGPILPAATEPGFEEILVASFDLEREESSSFASLDTDNNKTEFRLELERTDASQLLVDSSRVHRNWSNESGCTATSSSNASCESLFSSLHFWGAHIVIFANITYILPYLIVALVYLIAPGLRKRAYDRAVISYNILQILLNGILIGIGLSLLCHTTIHRKLLAPLGLMIMFLTISSTSWLFIICIDMTLVITRFRWTPRSEVTQKQQQQQQERRKFRIYSICCWTSAFLPTSLAAIFELSPLLVESSLLRPNFHRFDGAPNLAVVVYVATIPALTCLANTLLFIYTTYRIIVMKKSIGSTQLTATTSCETAKNLARKEAKERYWLFLKLYLLMDAPWITNALAAIFVDLWLLKFLRMIQPILMMFAILPRHTTLRMAQMLRGCLDTRNPLKLAKRSTPTADHTPAQPQHHPL